MESPLWTKAEACEYLRVSSATIERALANGQLSSFQPTPRGRHFFTKEMLDDFLSRSVRVGPCTQCASPAQRVWPTFDGRGALTCDKCWDRLVALREEFRANPSAFIRAEDLGGAK